MRYERKNIIAHYHFVFLKDPENGQGGKRYESGIEITGSVDCMQTEAYQ